MSGRFWTAIAVCCLQGVYQHSVMAASPSYAWICMAVAALAPLVVTYKQPLRWNSRAIADCVLDILSLALPAAAASAYPCAASLTAATLFRSLAMPLVALLKGNFIALPEAIGGCLLMTFVTSLRAKQCTHEQGSSTIVAALLLVATLCTAAVSVRQATEKTWPVTNVMRVPAIAALLWATSGYEIDAYPGFDFFVYCLLSLAASNAVLAYNASVNEDAYLKTRMLSVRRLISASIGVVVLDRYTLLAAWLSACVALSAFLLETRFFVSRVALKKTDAE
jgi:hypothetical protein